MGYTPEEIESKDFTRKFKGFDDIEVRNYLKHVSGVMASLRDELNESSRVTEEALARLAEMEEKQSEQGQFDALGSHVDDLLRSAQNVHDDMTKKAELDAAALVADAEAEAAVVRAEVERMLVETKAHVERDLLDAESVVAEANQKAKIEAEEILQAAQAEAARLKEQAEVDVADIRSSLETERSSLLNEAQAAVEIAKTESDSILAAAISEAERIANESEADVAKLSEESEAQKLEADEYLNTKQSEADQYFENQRAEADAYAEAKRLEAEEYFEERKQGVFAEAAEAEKERDKALAEIDEARVQVADLLEQARAQSEFLKQEAEELIREKVRNYIDDSERRVSRLRVTEQSARERLLAAQNELTSALAKVDSDQVQELGEGTSDEVLAEAEQRLLDSNHKTLVDEIDVDGVVHVDYEQHITSEVEILDLDTVNINPVSNDQDLDLDALENEAQLAASHTDDGDDSQVPVVEPNTSDPLSQLVREAMQQAVDTAAASESEIK